MSDTNEDTAEDTGQDAAQSEDRQVAYKEAAIDLGKGIALGLIPFLGQAIDAYDTVESSITLYQSKTDEEKENAQFDFLLALVGWIPGPGDGVKKSLRIVNRDPERFAPVLYDLLRFVLQECGIETSPETLLEEIFNAEKLKAQIDAIKEGVEDAGVFKALPESMQSAVKNTLIFASTNMPVLVGVVEKRLKKWRGKQRNSSANAQTRGPAKNQPPEARNADTAKNGKDAPTNGHANTSVNATMGMQSPENLVSASAGVSGEHMADYICVSDFGWGRNWDGHDKGAQGKWKNGKPNKEVIGKLSKGGVLYKLSDGVNGRGIDAVWRADGHNNSKRYAIVEAKATLSEDEPKFRKTLGNVRKPVIASKLLDNAPPADTSELIEPREAQGDAEQKQPTSNRSARKKKNKKPNGAANSPAINNPASNKSKNSNKNKELEILVQMSHEWIKKNIQRAVESTVWADIKKQGYQRHLFFCPAYIPEVAAHLKARYNNLPDNEHAAHKAIHYDEDDVRKAVNKRKARLRKKYGSLPSLKDET
jgi:hypothetical protein